MNARSLRPSHVRRYRRRILGWGAAGVVGLFAIGGPIFVNRVEDDLEQRTVEVLNDAGVGPVDAHFSGQDGELRCTTGGPVDIPTEVVESIENLWGVASLEVTASCSEPAVGGGPSAGDTGGQDGQIEVTDSVPPGDSSPTTSEPPETSVAPDLEPLTDVVASDSQFSTLAGLLADADLTGTLSGDGPFTVFAPTNEAFEALGADGTGALVRDPELLATVLLHHVAAGTLRSDDLVDGELEMLDGSSIVIDLSSGVSVTSGESTATITEPDLEGSNGVVHAIDQVLLPDGLVVGDTIAEPVAAYVDGRLVLTGTVASEAQRDASVAAPGVVVDPSNVIDELSVDATTPLSDETVDCTCCRRRRDVRRPGER